MSIPLPGSTKPWKLRLDAEARLKDGSAPPTKGWSTGANALNLLHKLASAPQRADEALKLLHELQVHQVELDLQHEQMEVSQRELAEDLARYQAFHEFSPVACLNLGLEGEILEANPAAAGLFGVAQDELRGRRIEALLAPESRVALNALLKRLRARGSRDTCEVHASHGNSARPLLLLGSVIPASGSILAVLVDTTDRGQPDPRV